MISVVILINGQLVIARSAVNRLPEVGAYVVDDGTHVKHNPDDGAVALAIKLLETIKEPPARGVVERCVCCTFDCGDRRGHVLTRTHNGGWCNCGEAWPCPQRARS